MITWAVGPYNPVSAKTLTSADEQFPRTCPRMLSRPAAFCRFILWKGFATIAYETVNCGCVSDEFSAFPLARLMPGGLFLRTSMRVDNSLNSSGVKRLSKF